jgi:CRP-like cAMP-binding protein
MQTTMAKCQLFTGLSTQVLDAIESKMQHENVTDLGAVIFENGDAADSMYFVVKGEVDIQSPDGGHLNRLHEGGFFGEIGVLFAGRRAARAVVSKAPCQLAVLRRTDLVGIATEHQFLEALHDRGQAIDHVRLWFVSQLTLFARLAQEPDLLKRIAAALKPLTFKKDEVVISEGDEGRSMYFIFDGQVSVSKRNGGHAAQLKAPKFFGELALLYAESRSATVRCSTQCRLYALERQAFDEILQSFPMAISTIYSTAQEAKSLKAHFIKKIPLFELMAHNEEFVANMSLALESMSAVPGEHIVTQGAASDGRMFAIAHGHAEVLRVKNTGEPGSIVSTLSAGSFFGEIALLLDTPRLASVVARGHCHVYTLSRDAFETLAVVYEDWWRKITCEHGVLVQKMKAAGVGICAETMTKTHGLEIPQIQGKAASAILSGAHARPDPCEIPKERLCVACLSAEKCILSVPCGHIATCAACHGFLSSCPICRVGIQSGHQAFF